MRTRFPDRFSYKHARLGLIVLLLFLLSAISVINPVHITLFSRIQSPSVYLFLTALIVYLGAEFLNYNDSRRFLENRYNYDTTWVYRESSPVLRWDEVSSIIFIIEVKTDILPAHRDVVWSPYFNLLKDYSVPDLTRRVRENRILFFREKVAGRSSDLTIVTTAFLPVFRSLYRRMVRLTSDLGLNVQFDMIKIVPEKEGDEEEGAVENTV